MHKLLLVIIPLLMALPSYAQNKVHTVHNKLREANEQYDTRGFAVTIDPKNASEVHVSAYGEGTKMSYKVGALLMQTELEKLYAVNLAALKEVKAQQESTTTEARHSIDRTINDIHVDEVMPKGTHRPMISYWCNHARMNALPNAGTACSLLGSGLRC